MIDTHAHIHTDKFADDLDSVLLNAKEEGVEKIIIPAIETNDFNRLIELIEKYEQIYCGIGIHPHNVANVTQVELDLVEKYQKNNKVIAIGEIGLDYYYDFAPKDKQKEIFSKQIEFALKNNKPIIVHNRESDNDVLDIINYYQKGNLSGVLHCFSSNEETLKKALDLGFYVSFTGNITFKNTNLSEIVNLVPNDRIMIETDSPYMTPVPFRGRRNEPAYVRFVAEKIALIKNLSFKEVVEMTSKNAINLFKIPILFIIFSLFSLNLASQETDEVLYDEEGYIIEEELKEREFLKDFGIGFVIGSNTIVEKRYYDEGINKGKDVSNSGKSHIAYGPSFAYYPLDFLQIKLAYMFAKNNEVIDNAITLGKSTEGLGPNTHQIFELSTIWIANSGSFAEFYGDLGFTYISNVFLEGSKNEIKNNSSFIGFGVGINFNLYKFEYGLLSLDLELKFQFETGRTIKTFGEEIDGQVKFFDDETSNIFSMPRATILYNF